MLNFNIDVLSFTMPPNVLQLGEVADFVALTLNLALNFF
jgi:hypothetical protein